MTGIIAKSKVKKKKDGLVAFKAYDYFPKFFPQKKTLFKNKVDLNPLLKKTCLLDDFSTIGTFEVLAFNKALAKSYKTLTLISDGWSKKNAKEFIKKSAEPNEKKLTFYVFSEIYKDSKKEFSDPRCLWKFYLKIGDIKLSPIKVEKVQEDPVLAKILEPIYDNKKTLTKVVFDLPNLILSQDTFFVVRYVDSEVCVKFLKSNLF